MTKPFLRPYNPAAHCLKCGNAIIGTYHCEGGWMSGDCTKKTEGEHLHRECGRCQYGWLERCLPPVQPPMTP